MKNNREWFVLGLAAIAVFGVCIFFAFQMVTERRLAASRAKVKIPATLTLYKELVSPGTGNSVDEKGVTAVTERTVKDRQYTEETLARYRFMFDWTDSPEDAETWNYIQKDILDNNKYEDWSADDLAQIEAYVSRIRGQILEIRALAERGGPVYRIDFTGGFRVLLPHLAKMRNFARLLRADAISNAMNGNHGEAVEDLIAGMKLSNALSGEPILISQLVRNDMQGIMYNAVQETFDWSEVAPDLARELVRQVVQSSNRDAFADSFLGEQHMGLDVFSQLEEYGWLSSHELMADTVLSDRSDWFSSYLYTSPLGRPWQHMDERDYTEIMGNLADVTRLPYYEAKPLLEQLNDDVENLPRTRGCFLGICCPH